MQKDSKIFDDMARMATNATGALFDMKREIEASVASQVEKFMAKSGHVSREEFEAVRTMATKAREENEALRAEIEKLKK